MSYKLTNNTGNDIIISPAINVPKGGYVMVDNYSAAIDAEKVAGNISVVVTTDADLVTDNSTGTAATDYTIAAIVDLGTAADAIATLAAMVNELNAKLIDAMERAEKLM